MFNNVPIVNAEGIDDQSSFTSGSPDYLFSNMNYLKLIFHREKFMQMGEPMKFPDKPDTVVVWCDLWYNLFNCSRQRHGYLQAS